MRARDTIAVKHHSPRRVYCWRKLASGKWEDAWVERLAAFADRLAITALAGAKTLRLEVFQLRKTEAERLRRAFGGVISVQSNRRVFTSKEPRAPIMVRDKLAVVANERERHTARACVPVLVIPAGLAFGTGDHATTASCLRLLADVAGELEWQNWEMLDLGCGSGILALAGRLLGARRAYAADFDPQAVRTARENTRANALRNVTVKRLDVCTWQPERTWDLVTANLVSGLLIEIAPKLAASVVSGGALIVSGILRAQETDVISAFRHARFRPLRSVRKGKWVALLARRAGSLPLAE
jgi:ribosomal protein L11 methyltransferase